MTSSQKKLSGTLIKKKLKKVPGWILNAKETQISKTFVMNSFVAGLAFIAKITVHAEVLEHHPDVELTYDRVKVKLTTHDVQGLTNADFELAQRIDRLRI